VNIADLHQRLDVRLVGMRGERVTEKDHQVDLSAHDSGSNLQVAAVRA